MGREPGDGYRRSLLHWCLEAIAASGAAWTGGCGDPDVPLEISRVPLTGRSHGRERQVQREVARGLADLERFLDRQAHA
jgi:hypothetical protein